MTGDLGIQWDTDDYQPLVGWKPCQAYASPHDGYDLFVVNFKLPFHSLSYTSHNSLLAPLSEKNPYAYCTVLNARIVRERGIRDGDWVRLESEEGYTDEGQVFLTECIHPEVIGIPGCFGRKSKGLALSHGKGVHFNTFVPHSLERIDSLSAALDSCVRVRCEQTYSPTDPDTRFTPLMRGGEWLYERLPLEITGGISTRIGTYTRFSADVPLASLSALT